MFNPTISSDETNRSYASTENFENLQKVLLDLKGEIEAIAQYDSHIRSTTSPIAKNTWRHIRDEELHHVGELLELVNYLSPEFKRHIDMGRQEWLNENNINM
ncbi:MAG: hypothetical protein IKQ31_01235 [Clostridia bacterium]|nr:hypothetical protein [Clostridia bacterium]